MYSRDDCSLQNSQTPIPASAVAGQLRSMAAVRGKFESGNGALSSLVVSLGGNPYAWGPVVGPDATAGVVAPGLPGGPGLPSSGLPSAVSPPGARVLVPFLYVPCSDPPAPGELVEMGGASSGGGSARAGALWLLGGLLGVGWLLAERG